MRNEKRVSFAVGVLALPILLGASLAFAGAAPILSEDSDSDQACVSKRPNFSKKFNRNEYVGFYDNPEYTPALDLLAAATKTIDIEIYEMSDKVFRNSLRAAMKRGVKVTVVKDPNPLGETCNYFSAAGTTADVGGSGEAKSVSKAPKKPKPTKTSPAPSGAGDDCADQQKLVMEVKQHGGAFVPFDKKALCGETAAENDGKCFEHGKVILIDKDIPGRALALVSTGNFNSSNLCVQADSPSTCNRDYSYVSRDPDVIGGLATIVGNDRNGVRYDPAAVSKAFPGLDQKLTVSPFSTPPLVAMIDGTVAGEKIQVQNQYEKDPDINNALMAAGKRGVKVEMMVASDCSFGPPKPFEIKDLETLYQGFEQAGIDLRLFTANMELGGHPGYLHAKTIVITKADGEQTAWLGSVNGSSTSLDKNREYGLFFNQRSRVSCLSSVMEKDQSNPESETWQESIKCAKDKVSKTANGRHGASERMPAGHR